MSLKLITGGLLALILAGCDGANTAAPNTDVSELTRTLPSFESEERLDEQGAVTVSVRPLNLEDASETLEFDVAMNTHSVELDMDLALLSTLTTDTGVSMQATLWDAERGGHHVSGTLIFPVAVDGTSLLEDASTLTLTIREVDVSERTFTWKSGG